MAYREATQGHTIDLLSWAKVVDDLGDGAALVGIPGILGELVVLDGGAVSILAASGAQVHAVADPSARATPPSNVAPLASPGRAGRGVGARVHKRIDGGA